MSDEPTDWGRIEFCEQVFGFEPFDYQRDLLEYAIGTDTTKVALKPGRQVGKSLVGGVIAAERALHGHDVMILAPYEDTTEDMMAPCRNALEAARQWVDDREDVDSLGVVTDNKRDWQFVNGGRVRARTVGTDGTQVRGKNPDIVLVDEAAYIPDRIYDQVIEPYFLTHDSYEYYLFSTPAGKSGYFYHAVDGDRADEWWTEHWPSSINPLNDEAWIERKEREKDSTSFAQEYLGEFVDEGDNFISVDVVRPQLADAVTLEGPVSLGVDVARKGKDRTVYVAMDAGQRARVLDSEDQSTIPGVVGRIKQLHREHDFDGVYVDENAVGGGVVDDEELNSMGLVNGVKFTTKSKHKMYNRLKNDLESGDITLERDRQLIAELTQLDYSVTANGYYKIGHPDGGHDDFADALALANWGACGVGQATVTRRSGVRARKTSTL